MPEATPVQSPLRLGTWMWDAKTDLLAFGGSALLALGLVAMGQLTGLSNEPTPLWVYVVFVLCIDVAHVWSTLFRTYLDKEEVAKRRLLYWGLPLACYATGVFLYAQSALLFWRVLAYLAVFHFMRQQVGFLAIYRAKAGYFSKLDRTLDNTFLYLSMGLPVLYWHAHLPRTFRWFIADDFIASERLRALFPRVFPALVGLYLGFIALYVARQLWHVLQKRVIEVGRLLLAGTTAMAWWTGIVLTDSDFDFTVTNVTLHGIPYFFLLWRYSNARKYEAPLSLGSKLLGGGLSAFLLFLFSIAFVEELLWDRFIFHDHGWLFGASTGVANGTLVLLVPLLALPQSTHYALDAFLWRRRDVTPAQSIALGFVSPTVSPRS